MKAFVVVGLLALIACGSALAKFNISIAASDTTPAIGDRVTLIVRSEQPIDHNLRLIAVAPGQSVFRVAATITGDTNRPIQDVQRRGFEVTLRRAGPDRWRGVARLPRTGRWRVIVPNWASAGVVGPNGVAMLTLVVR